MNSLKVFNRKLLNSLLIFGLVLLLSVFLGSLKAKKAMAFDLGNGISANAPQPGSADIVGGATAVQPWFAVGQGNYNGQYSYAKVYVPHGQSATLTVIDGNGVCSAQTGGGAKIDVGSPMVNYRVYNTYDNEKINITVLPRSKNNGVNPCGDIKFVNLSGSPHSTKVGHQAFDVYYFEAQITGPGIGDNEKNFRLSVSTNGGGPGSLVGVSRPEKTYGSNSGDNGFGIYFRNAPQINNGGNNWNYAVEFAPYCQESSNSAQRTIEIYDIDYGVSGYNQPNLRGLVNKDNRADSSFSWGLAPPGHQAGVAAITSERYAPDTPDDWPTGNHTNTALTFDYNNSNRYLLEFKDIDWKNTIQVELPFDQFDALQSVGQACLPSAINVTCTVGAQANVPPGRTINKLYTVNVTATGGGTGGNYSVQMSASPGAYVTGPNPNPQTVTVPNNPVSWSSPSLYFSGHLDYQGSFNVTVKDPSGATAATCSGTASPVVAPYFQVWQNDAAAGGGFNDSAGCPGAYPAYVSPPTASISDPTNARYYGGIRAFSGSGTHQSKTDFGAVALGLIPNPPGEGFVSPHNTLFANSGVPPIGGISGYFNHSSANPNHCAYDFYDETKLNPGPTSSPSTLQQTDIDNCDPAPSGRRCQYEVNGNLQISGLISIPSSTQVTVYVNGDVTIDGDINYAGSYDPTDRRTIPYFTIITRGDITLTKNVTQLDGLYIAQPELQLGGAGIVPHTGVFSTCDSQCPHQLVVNGAVIAQHVKLLRAHGSGQALGGPAVSNIGYAPAEIFNFTPAMVLGYPEFKPLPSGNPSLFSLPPVF